MRKAIFAVAASLIAMMAYGAGDTPLFSDKEIFKVVLSAPVSQAYQQKMQEPRLYLDGSWAYGQHEAGEPIRLSVKIRARGNFRRELCRLPPLQLNFKKKQVKGTLFEGQDKLKMVSPCKKGDKYQQYVYLEYLVYQLFALYSEYHFNTRLVEVGYADTNDKNKRWVSTNFLLEDESDMAARSGLLPLEIVASKRQQTDLAQAALVEIFQFMIGNVDYSTLQSAEGRDCCHNIKLVAPKKAEKGFIPVAYDFDSAGIINAPYARVPSSIPIERVTQRYFTGWCKEEKRYREAIALINGHREAAVSLFADSPLLDKRYRKSAVKFLEKSYELINTESFVQKKILGRCRGEIIRG